MAPDFRFVLDQTAHTPTPKVQFTAHGQSNIAAALPRRAPYRVSAAVLHIPLANQGTSDCLGCARARRYYFCKRVMVVRFSIAAYLYLYMPSLPVASSHVGPHIAGANGPIAFGLGRDAESLISRLPMAPPLPGPRTHRPH